jgi:hypothetical protein
MFELIKPSQLVEDKKYKIVSHKTDFIGFYKGKTYIEEEDYVYVYEVFELAKNKCHIHFSPRCSIYEMMPRAQQQMEQRAVNLIFHRLIGDDFFTW